MPAQLYTGYEQAANASVLVSGRTLKCTVWIDVAARSVKSHLVAVTDNGTEVEIFARTIATVSADFGPDSPRIIATESGALVVHWFEGDIIPATPANPRIRRYTLDLNSLESAAWTNRGTQAVGRFMHDLQPVIGHASDFVIAYVDGDDHPHHRRFNGLDWVDIDWDAELEEEAALRALVTYAHEGDNVAILAYERASDPSNTIHCFRVDAEDGTNPADVAAFTAMPDHYFWQGGFCRWNGSQVALVVEVSDIAETDYAIPMLAGVRITSATAVPATDEHWTHHLRLLGAPFAYAGARDDSTNPNVYALVGYSHAQWPHEFLQRNAFVVNMGALHWSAGGGDQTIRPRPVWVGNLGDFDCRVSGSTPDGGTITGFGVGRRIGCISSACAGHVRGPTLKTRCWAAVGFAKLMAIASPAEAPLQPVAGMVQGVRFQVEEPTQIMRDSTDPAAPSARYHGENRFTVGAAREAGGGVVIGGGCMAYYDRRRTFEVGYCWWPQILDVASGGAGNVDGTVLYCATYEQRDALGQLHRSAPSLPMSFTAVTDIVTLDIGTMTLSLRDNAFHYPGCPPINIVVWRTEAGGTVFYRVHSQYAGSYQPQDTPENDPTAGYITATDNVLDSELVNQDRLPYVLINGAWTPLPPIQPPAGCALEVHQNRVWIASSQDPRVLLYSQEMLPEQGGIKTLAPEFNPSLAVRIDGLGRVMALKTRDDGLLAYTLDSIASVTGIGADGAGADASYQVSILSRSGGIIEPRSLVETPAGILGQTRHGLYALSSGDGVEYLELGAKVADLIRTAGNVCSATYMKDRACVRWVINRAVTGSAAVLELDLLHMRWSVHPLVQADLPGGSAAMSTAVGGCSWTGTTGEELHVVVQQGALLVERSSSDATPYADQDRNSTEPVPLRVRFRPIHLDGINGFVLLRRVGLAFEKPNASGVRITHYAWRSGTYESVAGQVIDFASPALERPRPYGPRSQKCAAFWLDIAELATVPTTENIRILGVHIEAGIKRGLRKA